MRKNILIVGGSSGIGLSLVKQLQSDHNLIVANRSNEALNGLSVEFIPYDAENGELEVAKLPETLNGLVYCPGTINLRPFKGLRPEVFTRDFSINVMGAIKTLQAVLGRLQNSEVPASVVFFSTVAVQTGMPFHSSVATAKGALEGLSRSLAAELAPKIRFIGPSSKSILDLGNKSNALKLASAFNLPILGNKNSKNIENTSEAVKIANQIGMPIVIKAAYGGGGKGMRVFNNKSEIDKYFSQLKT